MREIYVVGGLMRIVEAWIICGGYDAVFSVFKVLAANKYIESLEQLSDYLTI